jgi:hypothetical protein
LLEITTYNLQAKPTPNPKAAQCAGVEKQIHDTNAQIATIVKQTHDPHHNTPIEQRNFAKRLSNARALVKKLQAKHNGLKCSKPKKSSG